MQETSHPLDMPDEIALRINPPVTNCALNALFAASWPHHRAHDFDPIHSHSLAYLCAFADEMLVGYVNLAWDGGIHAFVLDTTVHPVWRRRQIGQRLVLGAVEVARARGMHWVHVDYEAHLADFYRACGFHPTLAGLINLTGT